MRCEEKYWASPNVRLNGSSSASASLTAAGLSRKGSVMPATRVQSPTAGVTNRVCPYAPATPCCQLHCWAWCTGRACRSAAVSVVRTAIQAILYPKPSGLPGGAGTSVEREASCSTAFSALGDAGCISPDGVRNRQRSARTRTSRPASNQGEGLFIRSSALVSQERPAQSKSKNLGSVKRSKWQRSLIGGLY